jgi:hypothetical protein
MTERERFLSIIGGGAPDRVPVFDLEPAEDTVALWRRQGLPRGVSVAEHFGLEVHEQVGLEIRSSPFYRGAPDLLDGLDAFDRHYDPDDPDRIPSDVDARCERAHRDGRVVALGASGGGLLQMLGVNSWQSLVAACEALVERSAYVEALLDRTSDFHCLMLDRVLSRVEVDYATIYEPIASNAGPIVSPEMFERYAMPGHRRVLALLERRGVRHRILCTTGGDLSSLLPFFLDAGVNGLWISNIMVPEMEYRNLRREYGPEISLIGGIDATSLVRGAGAVRRAIEATVPPLLDEGRYLPCLNDRPRDDTPFDMYAMYREVLAEVAEGTLDR